MNDQYEYSDIQKRAFLVVVGSLPTLVNRNGATVVSEAGRPPAEPVDSPYAPSLSKKGKMTSV